MSIATISDNNFNEKTQHSAVPVLVVFTAAWSTPAKTAMATLEGLAPNYQGKLDMYQMDIDDNPNTIIRFSIQSVPTTLILKNGYVSSTQLGNVAKAQFQSFIDSNL